MDRAEIVVDGSQLIEQIRIGVKMPRAFGMRMWIATRLFELAGIVSGATVVVEVDDGEEPKAVQLLIRLRSTLRTALHEESSDLARERVIRARIAEINDALLEMRRGREPRS